MPLLLLSCSTEVAEIARPTGKVTVGFVAGDVESRTSINDDGISTSWERGDQVALWARSSNGIAALSATPFQLYYRDIPATKAMFTTTLANAMAEDTYDYYATYPVPSAVNGTKATFSLPTMQNGSISDGAAIMIATPTKGSQLGIVTGAPESSDAYEIGDGHLSLQMNHAMHALKFFIPSDKWGFTEGEKVEQIVVTMPQDIAGEVTLDYTDPSAAISTANGVKTISLNLKDPIGASSSAADIDFAAAAIIPTTGFASGDQMEIKTYTSTQASRYYISLDGRGAMQAGHITPVAVDCSEVFGRHSIRFIWGGNNLGEDVHTITFKTTAGAEIYRITNVAEFVKNGRHDVDFTFEDKSYLATIAGQQMIVEYESEHAIVSNTITMPADVHSSLKCHEITLVVPYLMFENFASLNNTYDNYGDDNKSGGDERKQPGESLNNYMSAQGWNAARFKISQGNCIRINVRYQMVRIILSFTTKHYGRLDTPTLSGLKSGANVKLKVEYDAGAHVSDGNFSGQNCTSISVATHTNGAATINGIGTGTLENGKLSDFGTTHSTEFLPDKYDINSFTQTFDTYSTIIPSATNATRVCFYPDTSATINGIGNEEFYVYLDNIKVSIVQDDEE